MSKFNVKAYFNMNLEYDFAENYSSHVLHLTLLYTAIL